MVVKRQKKIEEQMLFDNAPVESDDYEIEAQILDAQVKKQNVTNIGVVATYGAGKSSAINTYLKRYRKKGICQPKHVQISLADFNKDEIDANNENNNYSENAIERSILQQLFYSQKRYKLPKSSINRTNKSSFWLTAGCALLSIIFILSVIVLCEVCNWEYDEEQGYPEGGIAPRTKWENVPEDFECPLCFVGKEQFTQV